MVEKEHPETGHGTRVLFRTNIPKPANTTPDKILAKPILRIFLVFSLKREKEAIEPFRL